MTEYTSPYPQHGGEPPSTANVAKEQASTLKEKATDAGGQLLGEAKGEAAAVTQEAKRQLGDLWTQARTEVSEQAGTQQSRIAGGLTAVGSQFSQMANAPTEQNLATDIVREVGQRVDGLGQWLETHGPDEVLAEVRSFARRRPGTFLLIAAGAGVVLGRLTRGLKDAPSSPQQAAPTSAPTVPVRTSVMPEPVAEPLPVYADVVEERPRSTDAPATPVPATTWDQR